MRAITKIRNMAANNLLFRFYRYYIFESIVIVKRAGFKELLRTRGRKVFLAIIAYYTVRDTVVYILIPFIAQGFF